MDIQTFAVLIKNFTNGRVIHLEEYVKIVSITPQEDFVIIARRNTTEM